MCINAFHIWAFVLWLTSWVQSALRIQRSLVFLLHFDSHFVHCVHWLLVRCVDSAGPWWHKRKESRHWDGTPDSGRSGTAVLFIAAVNCCQWLCISLRWDGTPDSGGRGGTNFSALLYSWTLRVHFTEPGWNFRWWPLLSALQLCYLLYWDEVGVQNALCWIHTIQWVVRKRSGKLKHWDETPDSGKGSVESAGSTLAA